MALTWRKEIPFNQWFPLMLLSIIPLIACVYILGRERRARMTLTTQMPSKYLSLSSYFCIAIGPFVVLSVALQNLDGVCYILWNVANSLLFCQFVAMECFQLCRLHYCFSRERVHSDKGYPKILFVAMFSFLTLWILFGFVVNEQLYGITIGCGIKEHGDAFRVEYAILLSSSISLPALIWNTLFIVLDLTTLLLYLCKIKSFERYKEDKHQVVYHRIQSILHRVLILTFFYQIAALWIHIVMIIWIRMIAEYGVDNTQMFQILYPPVLSYAMHLMQDHNGKEYENMLRRLNDYKLYWCCCCCGGIVKRQYLLMMEDEVIDDVTGKEKRQSNTFSATDIKAGDQRNRTGMELSIATRTECTAEMDLF